MARPTLLPLALCMAAVLFLSTTFVQAPARTVEGPQRQLRVLETASMSTGLAMAGSLPAFATWGEGSESGQNIDPDSHRVLQPKGTERHGHLLDFCCLPVRPCRLAGPQACGEQVVELSRSGIF